MSPKLAKVLENEPSDEPEHEPATKPMPNQYPDDEERIRDALRKLPPDTRTRLKRLNETTKRREPHGILSPDEVTSEWVARRFGGGRYIIEILQRNDQGIEVIKTSAYWDIPGPYKGVGRGLPGIDDVVQAGPGQQPTDAPSSGRPVPTRELIDSALASRVMEVISREPQRNSMDLAGIAAVVTALGAIASPIIVKLMERGPDPALERIQHQLDAMRNAPGPTSSALHDALRGVRDIMSMKDLLTPDSGGGKVSMQERLMEALPDLIAAFTGKGAATPASPPPQLGSGAPDAGPTAASAAETPTVVADGKPPWEQLLKGFRDQLLYLANSGWEPEYCADLVGRTMPTEYAGLLTEFLKKPDAIALIRATITEMSAFETWLPEFVKELRTTMLGDEDDKDDEKAEEK